MVPVRIFVPRRTALATVFEIALPANAKLAADEGAKPPPAATANSRNVAQGKVRYVIPPGQEEFIGAMLGKGAALPDECKLDSGDVEKESIVATYVCKSGKVVFEFAHTSKAQGGEIKTGSFVIATKSGAPPPGLSNAIEALVRAGEAKFNWTTMHDELPPPGSKFLSWLWRGSIGLLFLAGILVALRRWRDSRGTASS